MKNESNEINLLKNLLKKYEEKMNKNVNDLSKLDDKKGRIKKNSCVERKWITKSKKPIRLIIW